MEKEYGIIKPIEPQFSVRELLVVPHKGEALTVSSFGPDLYEDNIKEMGKIYSHLLTRKEITFRPATTSESISAITYGFGSNGEVDAKRDILDSGWLQPGYIVRTQDGIFTNITETDESRLKQLLNKAEKVKGIYLINDKIAFAPYDSFETGIQDVDTFARGGLARVLEHTPKKIAIKLKEIGSKKNYPAGINVWGFDISEIPIVRVASLDSCRRDFIGDKLYVDGRYWYGSSLGYSFGVLEKQ